MITEDTSESEATARAADGDQGERFFSTWEAVNPSSANTLVQCLLQFYATPMRGDTEEDVCALLGTEGSDTFISAKLVEDFGYIIEPHRRMCGRQYPSGLLLRFDINFVS